MPTLGTLKLSVRELVEFSLLSGDISSSFSSYQQAADGSRIHRLLQKKTDDSYTPEVFMTHSLIHKNFLFIVSGRADGVINLHNNYTIDEIKTIGHDLPVNADDAPFVHWAQAICYGYFLSQEKELPKINLQLTYYQRETKEVRRFRKEYTIDVLKQHFCRFLDTYVLWADMQNTWVNQRNASIQALPFPFDDFRPGQRRLSVSVYKIILNHRRLFCQAPTGIGKTISTLFPGIKALGEGQIEKIFYFTAKTITRQAALNAIQQMQNSGLKIKTLVLTAKDKICFLPERDCNPENCVYARGYYDRQKDALFSMLQHYDLFTREIIESAAKAWKLCPFELSLDLSTWCDVIIGDYNYLFDPIASLGVYFAENENAFLFLIDEAHNLVDRSRSMFSAELSKSDFLHLKRELGKTAPGLTKITQKINALFIDYRKTCVKESFRFSKTSLKDLNEELLIFSFTCEHWLEKNPESPHHALVLDLYFKTRFYLKISEYYNEGYTTFIKTHGSEVIIKQHCLDPSPLLNATMKLGASTILFSGTLTPMNYFIDILGGGENTNALSLPSPFINDNLGLYIASEISTRYRHREDSILPIVEMIHTFIQGKTGNYIVYFPSYAYMENVFSQFIKSYPEIKTISQIREMDEVSRETFLNAFEIQSDAIFLGFCVLGGIYSEGIDLVGDRLIGTIIVGVGLPMLNTESEILKEYYEEKQGSGYAFAYQYPGMNKVLQGVGRVIRSETDKGVALLIDNRFTQWQYRQLFPDHWQHYQIVKSSLSLKEKLEIFWKDSKDVL
ncbi:MAG: ATP-dependent DNA helicase [Eubacteriaceae bacterium]